MTRSRRARWVLPLQVTADGSYTFFSPEFGECFHSQSGAQQEAVQKFVEPCQLSQRAHDLPSGATICLLDICYGLGYNSAAALAAIWAVKPRARVAIAALELTATVPQQAVEQGLLALWPPAIARPLSDLARDRAVETEHLHAQLWLGDARQTLPQLQASGFRADAIFLDPFSPPRCPALWTPEFLGWAARCLRPTGRLATYSCAGAVRTALLTAGLHLSETPAVGRRAPGTVASFDATGLPPLSPRSQEHLQTRAAVPYRDPDLCDSAAEIVARRRAEQAASNLEPTTRWKRRWANPQ
ncbi:MAG: hypothetical protein HC910_02700 [Spirulinaceae cyanobacterium SM2_1_0]|nr:hypothetical protein [Spirulinaceae cyanobacterium SM2_1_0]